MRDLLRRVCVIVTCVFGTAAYGQVFMPTVVDRSNTSPVTMSLTPNLRKLATTLKLPNIQNITHVADLPKPSKDQLAEAALDDGLKGLSDTTSDDQALKLCDDVAWALKNRWRPVRWKSERSVCFWNQPSLEWIRGAQIAGGDSQGTASVEIASDVFWGLRVRIQSSVAGTDASDPDGQAKALLKQMQTSGGNVSIGATYPWYALESPSKRVTGVLTSFLRVGGAIPALGADTSTTTIKSSDANGSIELALLDSMLQLQSFKKTINFVVLSRGSLVDGTHKFNEAIKNTGHRGYAYGQVGVGLRFSQVVWLVASRTYYSHALPGSGMTYSILFGKQPTPPQANGQPPQPTPQPQ